MGILLALVSVAALFGVTAAVHFAARRFDISAEAQRKLVHVAVGVHAMALPLVLDRFSFLLFAVLALGALLLLRSEKIRSGIGSSVHSVKRRSWGDVLFLAAVTVLFILAPGDPLLYMLPIAILTISDAAAAVIGSSYGQHRFGGGDRIKSIEGTVVFVLVTWVIAMIVLVEFTDVPRQNLIWLAIFIASFAAVVEADSWRGLDNLFIPLAVYTICLSWSNSNAWVLALSAIAWVALLLTAHRSAALLGVTAHQARTGLVALFLSAATVRWPLAVLPVAALGVHLLAMSRRSGNNDETPDFVLMLVTIGVFWLLASSFGGKAAAAFYAATFPAVIGAYAMSFAKDLSLPLRVATGASSSALAISAFWFLSTDLKELMWLPQHDLIIASAGAAALVIVTAAVLPSVILRAGQSWRIACCALPVLGIVYTYGVLT